LQRLDGNKYSVNVQLLSVVNICAFVNGYYFFILPKLKSFMPANIKTIELRNLQIEDYKELKNPW
jgi:hypothetical protein